MPGAQPWPCAFARHRARPCARPPDRGRRPGRLSGSEYCAPTFSQPPPLSIRSTVSCRPPPLRSGSSGKASSPRLFPLFLPVRRPRRWDAGRQRRVASATAARICSRSLRVLQPSGMVDVEDRRAGVLADGGRVAPRQLDVLQDGLQRAVRRRARGLAFARHGQRLLDIRRQVGRRAADQLQQSRGCNLA